MSACSKGGIGCALDNFHWFVESKSGKDTLHDTVGIWYDWVFPEVTGRPDAKSNGKTHRRRQEMILKVVHQLKLKRGL